MDLENSRPEPPNSPISEDLQTNFARHKEQYEKLRADVAVKMQFLDENRVPYLEIFIHNFYSNKSFYRLK